MLRIECPWCGLRDEDEFDFGGPSHTVRPAADASDAQWADYLFGRDNPKGVHYERWFHRYGCERWFNIARDTVTHAVLMVYDMGQSKPIENPHPSAGGDAVSVPQLGTRRAKFR